MAKMSIPLGSGERLAVLCAYPNIPGNKESLADTIRHWFGMTLERDGLKGEMASVRIEQADYVLDLDGPSEAQNQTYAKRLPRILDIGWQAFTQTIPKVEKAGKWDPDRVFLGLPAIDGADAAPAARQP